MDSYAPLETTIVTEGHESPTKGLINTTKGTPGKNDHSCCWYFGWYFLSLVYVAVQIVFSWIVIVDLIDIFREIHSYPVYQSGKGEIRAMIAIGDQAYGIIAIGQQAHGVFAIGQMSFGIFAFGQVGIGLLFALCQVGGGWFIAIGQAVCAAKIFFAQVGLAAWKVDRAQIGISLGASKHRGEKLFTYNTLCHCSKVSRGVHGIMHSIRCARYWPEDARKWMAEAIRNQSTESVIRQMVKKCAEEKYHGLHECTDDELEQVIDRLIQKKDRFKRRAMRKFPLQNNQNFGTMTMV